MYFNSGVVYFGIDAMTLLLMTVAAYGIIRLISLFTKSRVPENTVYTAEIYIQGKKHECRAFLDTGNSLTDCFCGEGVTVVCIENIKDTVSEEIFNDLTCAPPELKAKLIPVDSLGGSRLLPSFRADRIILKNYEKTAEAPKPVIAVCRERLFSGEFGAILHPSLLENYNREKGEINVR